MPINMLLHTYMPLYTVTRFVQNQDIITQVNNYVENIVSVQARILYYGDLMIQISPEMASNNIICQHAAICKILKIKIQF